MPASYWPSAGEFPKNAANLMSLVPYIEVTDSQQISKLAQSACSNTIQAFGIKRSIILLIGLYVC